MFNYLACVAAVWGKGKGRGGEGEGGKGEGDWGGEEGNESLQPNPWFFRNSRAPAPAYFYWLKSIALKG